MGRHIGLPVQAGMGMMGIHASPKGFAGHGGNYVLGVPSDEASRRKMTNN